MRTLLMILGTVITGTGVTLVIWGTNIVRSVLAGMAR